MQVERQPHIRINAGDILTTTGLQKLKKEEQSSFVKCFYLFSCLFTSITLGDSLEAKGKIGSSTHIITAAQQHPVESQEDPH